MSVDIPSPPMSITAMETKDAYATRVMEENKALIEIWTREQLSLHDSLIFNDHNLSFNIRSASSDDQQAGQPPDDFDVPRVHQTDLSNLGIERLRYVGGLDISFISKAEEDVTNCTESSTSAHSRAAVDADEPDAYATLVVVEYPSLELLHTITHPIRMIVPYIPTFLSYREAPAYLALIDALRTQLAAEGRGSQFPQVFLIDGNGQLHVRETGVASVVGVQANVPTIGVAKTFLPHHPDSLPSELKATASGHWRSSQQGMRAMTRQILTRNGSWFGLFNSAGSAYTGAALIPAQSKTPLFISPGHRVSLNTAIRVTVAMSKHRIPEPVRLADKISRAAAASRPLGAL